jgi:hypothetical protein
MIDFIPLAVIFGAGFIARALYEVSRSLDRVADAIRHRETATAKYVPVDNVTRLMESPRMTKDE